MISRRLLKAEIDKVKSEHLELLYGIIRLLEYGNQGTQVGVDLDWHEFVANTYGCLADAPISRADQGHFESREAMEGSGNSIISSGPRIGKLSPELPPRQSIAVVLEEYTGRRPAC